jgi:hypothetical protein
MQQKLSIGKMCSVLFMLNLRSEGYVNKETNCALITRLLIILHQIPTGVHSTVETSAAFFALNFCRHKFSYFLEFNY